MKYNLYNLCKVFIICIAVLFSAIYITSGQDLNQDDTSAIEEYLSTGKTLYREDKFQKAIDAWQKALEIDPANSRAQRYIERAQERVQEQEQEPAQVTEQIKEEPPEEKKAKEISTSLPKKVEMYIDVKKITLPDTTSVPKTDGSANSLTLKECIQIALDNSPTLKTSRREIKLARQKTKDARRALLPAASVKWEEITGTTTGEDFKGREFYLEMQQPVYQGGRLVNTLNQSRINLQVARSNYKKIKNDLVFEVEQSYYILGAAKRTYREMLELVSSGKEDFYMAEKEFEIDLLREVDYLSSKNIYQESEYKLVTSQKDLTLAYLTLFQTLNMDHKNQVIDIPELPTPELLELDENICERLALENRHDLKVKSLLLKFNKYGVEIAKGQNRLKVDLTGSGGYKDEVYITEDLNLQPEWYVGIKGSIPIWLSTAEYSFIAQDKVPSVGQTTSTQFQSSTTTLRLFDNTAYTAITEALVNLDKAKDEYNKLEKSVKFEVKQDYYEYEKAIYQLSNNVTKIQLSEKELAIVSAQKDLNMASINELMRVRLRFWETKTAYNQSLAGYYTSISKMNKTIGIDNYYNPLGEFTTNNAYRSQRSYFDLSSLKSTASKDIFSQKMPKIQSSYLSKRKLSTPSLPITKEAPPSKYVRTQKKDEVSSIETKRNEPSNDKEEEQLQEKREKEEKLAKIRKKEEEKKLKKLEEERLAKEKEQKRLQEMQNKAELKLLAGLQKNEEYLIKKQSKSEQKLLAELSKNEKKKQKEEEKIQKEEAKRLRKLEEERLAKEKEQKRLQEQQKKAESKLLARLRKNEERIEKERIKEEQRLLAKKEKDKERERKEQARLKKEEEKRLKQEERLRKEKEETMKKEEEKRLKQEETARQKELEEKRQVKEKEDKLNDETGQIFAELEKQSEQLAQEHEELKKKFLGAENKEPLNKISKEENKIDQNSEEAYANWKKQQTEATQKEVKDKIKIMEEGQGYKETIQNSNKADGAGEKSSDNKLQSKLKQRRFLNYLLVDLGLRKNIVESECKLYAHLEHARDFELKNEKYFANQNENKILLLAENQQELKEIIEKQQGNILSELRQEKQERLNITEERERINQQIKEKQQEILNRLEKEKEERSKMTDIFAPLKPIENKAAPPPEMYLRAKLLMSKIIRKKLYGKEIPAGTYCISKTSFQEAEEISTLEEKKKKDQIEAEKKDLLNKINTLTKTKEAQKVEYSQKALQCFSNNDYRTAIKEWAKVLTIDPYNIDAIEGIRISEKKLREIQPNP